MSQPFVGEVRLVGFNFNPQGWFFCDGSTLSISQYEVLFALIGTTYGGNGQTSFMLPDLRGRIPLHQGPGYVIGQPGGVEQVAVTAAQLPAHTHTLYGSSNAGSAATPAGNVVGSGSKVYSDVVPGDAMNAAMVAPSQPPGGSQPHDNRQPYLTLNWIIAYYGVFPSQS